MNLLDAELLDHQKTLYQEWLKKGFRFRASRALGCIRSIAQNGEPVVAEQAQQFIDQQSEDEEVARWS